MKRVAVIGGGVGGMTAAGLLAKRGADVVLFEQAAALGGKAKRVTVDGLTFDTGPTLLALPHFIEEIFEELGADMPKLHRLDQQCRYVFADGRTFTVWDALDATLLEAERFGDTDGLREFYAIAERTYKHVGEPFLRQPLDGVLGYARAVAKNGLGALWFGARMGTLDALARRCVRSNELRQFIGRFATYVGASPFRASAAYAMIPHVELAFGVHHPEGGMGAIAEAMERAILRAGVDVRLGTRAQMRRESDGYRVGEERFDHVVVNADPAPPGSELSLSAYVQLLRVPGQRAWPHHTILFSADYAAEFAALNQGTLPDDTTIYVCNAGATERRDGDTALYVMINTPPWDGTFPTDQVRERLRKKIAPDATVVGERTPEDFARTGSPRGALYGAVGHGRLGPFRRPRMRGGDGEVFVGGGTHPGGGVPMVARSGRFAADMLS